MGKAYAQDIRELTASYRWALEQPCESLSQFSSRALVHHLLAVGSGGSFTTAEFARRLHEHYGGTANSITPLDLISRPLDLFSGSVLLLTAGGRNPDSRAAFARAIDLEPQQVAVLCSASNTPLKELSAEFDHIRVLEYPLPSGKDGFLATNSLLAACTLLIRAYAGVFGEAQPLDARLLDSDLCSPSALAELPRLLACETWTVLYNAWGQPAAVDLESKCTESALSNVRLADYRNFGHGRHYWLARRSESTGIVALVTPEDKVLAERTLRQLPASIPVVRISTENQGPAGGLALLASAIRLVGHLGAARNEDPGRPSVPMFGRRLYSLSTTKASRGSAPATFEKIIDRAISRKLQSAGLRTTASLPFWRSAFETFYRRVTAARFGSMVFDFDGTLCSPHERFGSLRPRVQQELLRLLHGGIVVGIATGRGASVRTALREFIPAELQSEVIIGYYNGSDIGLLSDMTCPNRSRSTDPSVAAIVQRVERDPVLRELVDYECRPMQLSLQPHRSIDWNAARAKMLEIANKHPPVSIQIVESSHSMDILAPGVSKIHLIEECERLALRRGNPSDTLCVGDRGALPGNDAALLSTPFSLSVDSVSADPDTCWNLAAPGLRGVPATLQYLAGVEAKDGSARIELARTRTVSK